MPSANEAQTEERFIRPILRALGFSYEVQADLAYASRRRQPDYALFLNESDRRNAASGAGVERYGNAVAVADAKRFDRPLDARQGADDPVAQIINYVFITRRSWGVLTNGRVWRLYGIAGDLLEGACYEVDLVALLEAGDAAAFRYFSAFFSASAFTPDGDGVTFLERALAQSVENAISVGDALQRQVFAALPLLAEGLLGEDERTPGALAEAFINSLTLLYRLLFCLHSEARGLLRINNPHYQHFSLRRQKIELARNLAGGRVFRDTLDLYDGLRALFRIVDRGDGAIGVNEYNGGLFSPERHPYFVGRTIPDRLMAPALDNLYRVGDEFVDYRDLSVRHLGTIYERLLDFVLVEADGRLRLAPGDGRHESGSYFTPERVVQQLVERTLDPLLESVSNEVVSSGATGDDALHRFLRIRVVDPAMGSGHFLVAATAYIATYIATEPAYDGDLPLASSNEWSREQCIYGVDLNPLAVELAQLSLWLVTAREGEPLTFLNNLRAGNSLVGARLSDLMDDSSDLFVSELRRVASQILDRLAEITSMESRAGDAIHAKEALANSVDRASRSLEA